MSQSLKPSQEHRWLYMNRGSDSLLSAENRRTAKRKQLHLNLTTVINHQRTLFQHKKQIEKKMLGKNVGLVTSPNDTQETSGAINSPHHTALVMSLTIAYSPQPSTRWRCPTGDVNADDPTDAKVQGRSRA
ncbi:hypothetical protein MMC13_008102 [Lambiella insularis]|nr:hypothetical protein [Lambiella insularis]